MGGVDCVEVVGRHDAAVEYRRRPRPVGLVVADHGEVDENDLRAGGLEVGLRLPPEIDDGGSGLDALTGRGSDAATGSGIRILSEVHRRDAEPPAPESADSVGGQRGIRLWSHLRRGGDRHPSLRAPEVAPGLRVVGDDEVEHLEQVGHRTGVRHDDVHRGDERPIAAHRDHASRRRVGAQCVVRSRRASRGPGLLAEPERGEARGGRGARSVRRARPECGGEVVGVVGAFGSAVQPALHAAVGHRRHVRQPDQHAAGATQPLDRERIPAGYEIRESGAARGHRHSAHHVAVLRGERDAVERASCCALAAPSVGFLRLRQRVGVELDDRVETDAALVVHPDAAEVGLGQLDARGRARLERGAEVGDGGLDDRDHDAVRFDSVAALPRSATARSVAALPRSTTGTPVVERAKRDETLTGSPTSAAAG